ncbi:cupredoxin domain-containing protein [Rummeliibacillus sp. JY-2-4R]
MKKIFSLIIVGLLAVLVVGCGAKDEQPSTDSKATESSASNTEKVKSTGNVVEVTITSKNFDFDQKEIKAKVGDTVKIHFKNDEGAHGFGLDAFGGISIKNGETAEFVVDKAGTYEYYCTLMCGQGHDNMMGKLIVE